jgi:protein-L-isoaspartate(D-aspartate) O-methyltransferase
MADGTEDRMPTEAEDDRVQAASLVLRLCALGVSDRRVLKAIETVPRPLFVPLEWRRHAWEDRALPADCDQTISAPSVVAIMSAALDVSERHHVLEIGTGTGYQTTILARIARRVTTIERHRKLVRAAEARWAALRITNVTAIVGDGMLGWPRQAPFERILVTAAAEKAPSKLVAQLADGGILVAPIGPQHKVQRLTLFHRQGERVDTRDLGGVRFVPIVPGLAQGA